MPPPWELEFSGGITAADTAGLEGDLSLSIPSISELIGWLAIAQADTGYPVETITLESELSATPTSIGLQTATLTIDDLAASGDLQLGLGGLRPLIFGRLAVDQLNLDPFLGAADSDTPSSDPGPDPAGGSTGWSDDPIDFSPLMLVDTDLVIASEGVTLRGVEAGPSAVTINLMDGVLDLDLARTALFGGHVAVQVGANGAASTPTVSVGIQIDEVQAEPILTSFAEFDRLSGATDAEIALTSAGNSQRALIEALDGSADLIFRNGSIKGINLAAMVRNVASAFTDPTAGETRSTDFAELGASFQIDDGVATSNDMRLLAPLLRIEGAGQVSLPPRTQSVRLIPKLVASSEGQGGALENAGIAVPIIVEGSFENPTFRPDLESLITNTLTDPGAIGDQLEGLADQLREGAGADPEGAVRNLLEGLTGGGGGEGQPGEPAPAPDPGETLRNLFGG